MPNALSNVLISKVPEMFRQFRDRQEAGRQLGDLVKASGFEKPVVLGIPRGGVPVAAEVAKIIDADLGVVVARKLGAPMQPELAIGAVTADGVAYINQELAAAAGADEHYLSAIQRREAAEAKRREEQFDSRRRPDVVGRPAIIIDDGVATGATAIAAIRSLKAAGATPVVFAIPVGPPHTIKQLRQEADIVICLHEESDFWAVGQFYMDFHAVEDHEVKAVLEEARGVMGN
jgi:putative phosphoribosyl transferase